MMKDAALISGVLPHRYPFLMLDRVLEVIPGRRAVGEKIITENGFYSAGRAVSFFPELFLLEAMAQLGAIASVKPDKAGAGASENALGYLAGLKDARFAARPRPGDRVLFTVEYEAGFAGLVMFSGRATAGDELLAESKLTFTNPG